MLQARKLNDDIAVAGQIEADDVAEIARAGFRTIICNRPDGEAPDQPEWSEIAAAARAAGVEFRYIPVTHAGMTQENVDATREALASAPKPLFAYCRSGARSANLYSFASSSG